jgi:hypothetical protein
VTAKTVLHVGLRPALPRGNNHHSWPRETIEDGSFHTEICSKETSETPCRCKLTRQPGNRAARLQSEIWAAFTFIVIPPRRLIQKASKVNHQGQ